MFNLTLMKFELYIKRDRQGAELYLVHRKQDNYTITILNSETLKTTN
jgi:hypothetical protein